MNKQTLIANVAEATGLTKKDVTTIVEATLDTITGALASGEKVQLQNFGNFEVRERSARDGRNPSTGEPIKIPASLNPAWKPAKAIKELVNQ